MPTGARTLTLPCSTEVSVEKFFPVDDDPARSADCISWGPHNVLQVCTRWGVSMYLANLLAPACQCGVRNHPLSRRGDGESLEIVVGAKWSASLLPEVYYPASARLCVQTTSNLVVYRVSRHGMNRVVASHGIGIACFRCERAFLTSQGNETAAESAQKGRRTASFPAVEPPGKGKSSVGTVQTLAKSALKGNITSVSKTASTTTSRKRGRHGSSPSTTITNDRISEDESVSGSGSETGSRTSSSKSNNRGSSRRSADESTQGKSLGSGPAPQPRASITGAGKKISTQGGAMSTSANAHERQRSSTATSQKKINPSSTGCDGIGGVLDYLWLDKDDLVVLTRKGLHVVALVGNFSDEVAPVTLPLPPPLYRWGGDEEVEKLGFRGSTPLCMTTLFTQGLSAVGSSANDLKQLRQIIVIASPYMLRVMDVSYPSSAHSTATVRLAHIVEVPSLTSVPTSVCAVAVQRTGPTAIGVGHSPPGLEVDVVAFVSAPGGVVRGRFPLAALSSFSDSAVTVPCRRTVFQADAHYGLDTLRGEVCLRRLMVVPFSGSSRAVGVDVGGKDDSISPQSRSSDHGSVAVLGIGEKSMHEFLVCGPSSTALFQCPLLVGCSEMPLDTCAGIVGVALHPSGTLAVAAVQSGQASEEPTHLWPVSVNTCDVWLSRLVALGGLVPEALAGSVHEVSALERAMSPYELSGSTLRCMLLQQVSSSFFLYEQLLPGSVTQCSEVHQYAQAHQQARQLPSTETMHAYRRWMMSGGSISSPKPCLPDMFARRRYLQLRAQFGVDLFLRWPLKASAAAGNAANGISSVFLSPSSMEVMQASWSWWLLLQHIRALCPWDWPVVSELVLANAVLILAKRYRYANMALEGSEHFRDHVSAAAESACCSTGPDALDVDGAIAFVEAYIKAQEAALRKSSSIALKATSVPNLRLITVADCGEPAGLGGRDEKALCETSTDASRLEAQVHWCVSPSWASALKAFLETTAYTHRRNVGVSSPLDCDSIETSSSHMFPCSLCDRPACVPFRLSLSSTSTHVPASESSVTKGGVPSTVSASHTTLFSGSTLSPLSFFSENYVLTRCLACGLSDFADGPQCRVCGGLLE